jgi:pimeloyl-ACP methyl ester carboxylesterase
MLSFMTQQGNSVVPMGLCLENYNYAYPVTYLTLKIQRQELKMAYMDVQPQKANGRTVLLLHGKNFNGAYWGQTARELAGRGYRVIVPDQIGFGKSSKPQILQYTFQLLAAATKAVLDTAGVGKAVVIAHSMGGMVGTRFVLSYPDRVEKFILEDPIGLEDWKLKVPYPGMDARYEQELNQNYDSLKKYELESYYHGTWSPAYDEWLNIYAGWMLSPEYSRIAWNSALTYDMIFTQPVCYEFAGIWAPSMLIVGKLDRTALGKNLVPESVAQTMGNYPELGRVTAAKIPNCRLVEMAGVGHVPHVEVFDQFMETVLSFL